MLDDESLRVRMGFSFRAEIPRPSIKSVNPFSGLALGIGVHGWRGQWLVNGSTRSLVTIEIDPPAPAKVLGIPVRLRILQVSIESPEQFMAALRR